MRYWIFQANPRRFDIARRLADPEPSSTWLVSRHKTEIAPGDRAFIWQSGPQRGICAIMQVESAPADLVETPIDAPYWADRDDMRVTCRVRGTFVARFPLVPVDKIMAVPGLRNLSILRAPQGTNFTVSDDEADLLVDLLTKLGAI